MVLNNLVVTNSATLILSGTTVITATNITVAKSGTLSADEQGYGVERGPGAPGDNNGYGGAGAGHGGYGGAGGNSLGGAAYGNFYQPETLGSGGRRANSITTDGGGGGAIHLVVNDTFTVDGIVSTNGGDGGNGWRGGGGGSGGSIWIETAAITGNGTIRANGGDGDNAMMHAMAAVVQAAASLSTPQQTTLSPVKFKPKVVGDTSTAGLARSI